MVDGLPSAANVAHAFCMVFASCCCVASSVAGTGVFGWSNRYWISDECVAIGGNPLSGGAIRCGAVPSSNWYANVGTRDDIHWSTCTRGACEVRVGDQERQCSKRSIRTRRADTPRRSLHARAADTPSTDAITDS